MHGLFERRISYKEVLEMSDIAESISVALCFLIIGSIFIALIFPAEHYSYYFLRVIVTNPTNCSQVGIPCYVDEMSLKCDENSCEEVISRTCEEKIIDIKQHCENTLKTTENYRQWLKKEYGW